MNLDVDFDFEAGEVEKHRVAFRWNQMWGVARITVDGDEVLHERHFWGFKRIRQYTASFGKNEVHKLVIEKSLQMPHGGFRKQMFRVSVDGEVVGEY
jgi:hypothetical protein